jgi:hypothetical protein
MLLRVFVFVAVYIILYMCYRHGSKFVKVSFICKFLKRVGSFGRPRHRWEDNNKVNLQEVGWGGVDWIELAQDEDKWSPLLNAVMNVWVL